MYIVKRIFVFFAAVGFSALLLLLVSASVFRLQISDSNRVKFWLKTSGAYENFTEAVLEQSTPATVAADGSIPLDDPALIAKAKEAFNAEFLQTNTETVLDGIFSWLSGETYEPRFTIDFSGPKQEFARLVSEHAVERYNGLPACDVSNLPTSVDPFNDLCKIPSLGTEKIQAQIQEGIAENKDVFGQTTFTAASFASKNNPSQSVFQDLAILPKVFFVLRIAPFMILAALTICVLILIFADKSRRKGLKKIGVTLLINGILVLIFTFASAYLFKLTNERYGANDAANSSVIAKVINPLIETANNDIMDITLIFGISYVLLGSSLLLGLFIYNRQQGSDDHKPYTNPEPASKQTPIQESQLPTDSVASRLTPPPQSPTPAFRSYDEDSDIRSTSRPQPRLRQGPTQSTRRHPGRTLIQ